MFGVSNGRSNAIRSTGEFRVRPLNQVRVHLITLKLGRTRPVHCRNCRDKGSFPKVRSRIRGEYRLIASHSMGDGGACQHIRCYSHGPGNDLTTTLTLASSATSEKHRTRGKSEFRRRQRRLREGSENVRHVRASTASIRRSSLLGRCGGGVIRHSRTHSNKSVISNGLRALIELLGIARASTVGCGKMDWSTNTRTLLGFPRRRVLTGDVQPGTPLGTTALSLYIT